MKKFSFRQKILIAHLVVFFVFVAAIYPLGNRTVKNILKKGMEDRATELIAKIQTAPNNNALIRQLKETTPLIVFRISVITNERRVIYDSHTKKILGIHFNQDFVVSHPEVAEAFRAGTGYHEEYSEILTQDFAYFAKAFNFHGKTYVLRTAFPLRYIEEITNDFEFGFLGSAIAILLLFTALSWFVIHYLTRPIHQIIQAVKPYQESHTQTIPQILLGSEKHSDEFGQLANTLNSLSIRVQKHIDTLTVERNEKKAVLESLIEGVISVNNNMIVTYINSMATKLLGMAIEDILDKPAAELKNDQCNHILEKCQKENKILRENMEVILSGEKLYLEIVAAPKKNEAGAILILQDKTEHYRIIEMRKDFVANASHELKTPITIIRGFAEALHDNPDLPKETQEEVTAKIVRNCVKMNDLIKDLLTLTDIEHIPESRLMDVDLAVLAENAKSTVQHAYQDASIEIQLEQNVDYTLLADPNLMELCFVNLLENAAKYSPPPAKIKMVFYREKDGIIISINDKGYGIPKADLKNIFQRFYRSEKSYFGKKIAGSGLGLSIVQMIITKHFGKISVQSVEGEGSTFTMHLPIRS